MNIQTEITKTSGADYDAVVIGAGFGGLYAVHKLRNEQGLNVRGYDSASDVGGTWWWNRYPGAKAMSTAILLTKSCFKKAAGKRGI